MNRFFTLLTIGILLFFGSLARVAAEDELRLEVLEVVEISAASAGSGLAETATTNSVSIRDLWTEDSDGNRTIAFNGQSDIHFKTIIRNTRDTPVTLNINMELSGLCDFEIITNPAPFEIAAGTEILLGSRITLPPDACPGAYELTIRTTGDFFLNRTAQFFLADFAACSDDLPINIIDNQTVSSTLPVLETGTITDLNVQITAYHAWVGDLDITLNSPTSSALVLTSSCSSSDVDVVLDDEAFEPVNSVCYLNPAISGELRPTTPLSVFDNSDISGTWTLDVADSATDDDGQLISWCLFADLAPTTPPAAPLNVQASDGSLADRVRIEWLETLDTDSYKIYRNTVNNPTGRTEIGTTTTPGFDDMTAAPGTPYYYWVVATNTAGDSAFSAPDIGSVAEEPDETVIGVYPGELTLLLDASFCVDITVEEVTNLGSFSFALDMFSGAWSIASVQLGNFPGSTGRSFTLNTPVEDHKSGRVTYSADSTGAAPGATGSGVLAVVCFNSFGGNTEPLNLYDTVVNDVIGAELPHMTEGGTVHYLTGSCTRRADFDCNDMVDIIEVQRVAGSWTRSFGEARYDSLLDIDSNGVIDLTDIQASAAEWNVSPFRRRARSAETTPQTPAHFYIVPETIQFGQNQTLALKLFVRDAVDLAAFELRLADNDFFLEFQGATMTDLLATDGRTDIPLAVGVDPFDGFSVRLGAATYGDGAAFSGDGHIATFEMKATGFAGDSGTLNLFDVVATDAEGVAIAATVAAATPYEIASVPTAVGLGAVSAETPTLAPLLTILLLTLLTLAEHARLQTKNRHQ